MKHLSTEEAIEALELVKKLETFLSELSPPPTVGRVRAALAFLTMNECRKYVDCCDNHAIAFFLQRVVPMTLDIFEHTESVPIEEGVKH